VCILVQVVGLANGESLKYDKLCVCTGAKPKVFTMCTREQLCVYPRVTSCL